DHRYFDGKPDMQALLERERENAEVAQKVYDLRIAAGLTQRELARRVGTTPSVISRLEDADYNGHSLTMLRRIAAAVGKRVEIQFVPSSEAPRHPTRNGTIAAERKDKSKASKRTGA